MSVDVSIAQDAQLLAEYAQNKSVAAFEQIVSRYADLVYSAALRQVHDAHLAEDVTQAVFLIFSQRAGKLDPRTVLAGWFLLATRNVASNALKREWRLKRREKRAAKMHNEPFTTLPPEAQPVVEQLDSALARLRESDRNLILQRFYLSKSHREIGQALGLSEEAASKRLSRALGRLRKLLARSGVTASEATLSAALPVIADKSAPPVLVASIQASAAGTAAASPAVLALAKTAVTSVAAGTLAVIGAVAVVVMGVGIYVAATLLDSGPEAPTQAAPAALAADPRTMTLVAIDPQTEQPVADATVQVQIDNNLTSVGQTDAQGKFVVQVPADFNNITARVRSPGRVPMRIVLQNYTLRGGLPPVYTIPLEKGTAIGGTVVDSLGNPLAYAKVNFYSSGASKGEVPTPDLDREDIYTDAEGRWQYPDAPSKLERLYVSVTHADYPGDSVSVSVQAEAAKLRNFTAITTLRSSGRNVSGVVMDSQGKPVEGAQVVAAQDRFESNKPTAKTDERGQFQLRGVGWWQNVLTVTARGFAPELVELSQGGDWNNVTIRLSSPKTIEALVVQPDGSPLAGASVEVEQWRGYRALKWTGRTDSKGRFVWTEAPADEVQFNIRHKNRMSAQGVKITAGGEPARITVYPPVAVSGTVVDKESKQPIPQFRMMYGIKWSGQKEVTWQTHDSRTLTDGKYDANLSNVNEGARLRVEADGYLPAESRLILPSEGRVTIDFELEKGSGPSGMVVDAEGKPVANAMVCCVPSGTFLYLGDESSELANYPNVVKARTNKAGQFTCLPLQGDFQLIVLADAGFTMLSGRQLAEKQPVRLQPWGQIEGVMRIGIRPASEVRAAAHVSLRGVTSQILIERSTKTDAEGHFVIDRLPPGIVQLYRVVPLSERSSRYLTISSYYLNSGQKLSVQAGGAGRPVIGRLVLPEGIGQQLDFVETTRVHVQPKPTSVIGDMVIALMKGSSAFIPQTPVEFYVLPDGSLRADEVPEGTYQLQINVQKPYDHRQPQRRIGQLAQGQVTFTVPEMPQGTSDEPLDLGDIQLQPVKAAGE